MKYVAVVYFEGEAEIEVEADNAEEAAAKARTQFSTFDIDDANIVCVDVSDEE